MFVVAATNSQQKVSLDLKTQQEPIVQAGQLMERMGSRMSSNHGVSRRSDAMDVRRRPAKTGEGREEQQAPNEEIGEGRLHTDYGIRIDTRVIHTWVQYIQVSAGCIRYVPSRIRTVQYSISSRLCSNSGVPRPLAD